MKQILKRIANTVRPGLKLGLGLSLVLAVSGCTLRFGQGDWGHMFRLMKVALNTNDIRVSFKQAAAVPYASLGYRLQGGPERMLVLISDAGTEPKLWSAGQQVALITTHGRITRTAGLPHNLEALNRVKTDDSHETDWFHDGTGIWLINIEGDDGTIRLSCSHHDTGYEPVHIIGQTIAADRIDEHCVSQTPSVRWSFTNSYWVNKTTGELWQVRQHLHPEMEPVIYEIFRQPG